MYQCGSLPPDTEHGPPCRRRPWLGPPSPSTRSASSHSNRSRTPLTTPRACLRHTPHPHPKHSHGTLRAHRQPTILRACVAPSRSLSPKSGIMCVALPCSVRDCVASVLLCSHGHATACSDTPFLPKFVRSPAESEVGRAEYEAALVWRPCVGVLTSLPLESYRECGPSTRALLACRSNRSM